MGGDAERAYATFSEQRAIGRRFADPDLLTLAGFGQGQALIAMGRIPGGGVGRHPGGRSTRRPSGSAAPGC
jgi:hypothetical protein